MAVTGNRRRFRCEGAAAQRDALRDAAPQVIAKWGARAAALRALARRAGATSGPIRHSLQSRQDRMRAACGRMTGRMQGKSLTGPDTSPDGPAARMAAFVAALLPTPVAIAGTPALWAAVICKLRIDPQIRLARKAACPACRDPLRQRIGARPRPADGALPGPFAAADIPRIGRTSVGAIANLDLLSHLPEAP